MKKSAIMLIVLGLVFVVVSLVAGTYMGLLAHKQLRSAGWPSVQGVVTESRVATSTGSKGRTRYKPRITYTYQIDGKPYTSDRDSFTTGFSTNSRQEAQDFIDKHPVGSAVMVYSDPFDPAEALIRPGLNPAHCAPLVFISIFLLVGLLVVSIGLHSLHCRGPGYVGTKFARQMGDGSWRMRPSSMSNGTWSIVMMLLVAVPSLIAIVVFQNSIGFLIIALYFIGVPAVGLLAWLNGIYADRMGRTDIVIDQLTQRMTLPNQWQHPKIEMPFENVLDTKLIQDSSISQNKVRGWRVHLVLAGQEKTRPIVEIHRREDAAELEGWVREKLALGPAEARAADAEV